MSISGTPRIFVILESHQVSILFHHWRLAREALSSFSLSVPRRVRNGIHIPFSFHPNHISRAMSLTWDRVWNPLTGNACNCRGIICKELNMTFCWPAMRMRVSVMESRWWRIDRLKILAMVYLFLWFNSSKNKVTKTGMATSLMT